MASSTQDNVTLAQGAPTVAVGQTLKTARELMGKDIGEVAEHLRIRQPFLQALEDGRHKDLPGGTYAIGFLRTYAEFLGLDGEEMVRRFRAEAAGELDARSELVFPSPVSEGRIPGGAVLFMGVIFAGLAYGGWYFLSSRSSTVAEMVPPLPDRLASVLRRPATVTGEAPKPVEAAPKPDETTTPKSEDAQAPVPTGAGKETEVVPPAEEEEAKPAPAPQAVGPQTAVTAQPPAPPAPPAKPEAPKAEQTKPTAAKPETVKPEPTKPEAIKTEAAKAEPAKAEAPKPEAPKAEPAKTEPAKAEVAKPTADAPKPAEPAKPVEATKPTEAVPANAPAPAAAPAADTPVPDGKVIGQEHTDARIVLKAAADDCWVQVREMDGQLLLSRLLRRGDSYMVPNRPGLTLMVGNAGALDVLVDGKKVPALGNTGQVRRDIKLEADKLLAP
ncbi:MAG TPA: RodZ domain-containing protein [Magnetospirillum sp.]|nr:RodZ domain-containing protein [Magnetospirillum sp.]